MKSLSFDSTVSNSHSFSFGSRLDPKLVFGGLVNSDCQNRHNVSRITRSLYILPGDKMQTNK